MAKKPARDCMLINVELSRDVMHDTSLIVILWWVK